MREFMYWANMADEDKKGKFMVFTGATDEFYEDVCSMVCVVGTPQYFVVPLDCIDVVRLPSDMTNEFINCYVTVLDVPHVHANRDITICNELDWDDE